MELLNQMDGFDQTVNVKVGGEGRGWGGGGHEETQNLLCPFRCESLLASSADITSKSFLTLLTQQLQSGASKTARKAPDFQACHWFTSPPSSVSPQVIMATNRADTLDPALLRPGRLDRKIEFPLPDRRQKRLVFQVIVGVGWDAERCLAEAEEGCCMGRCWDADLMSCADCLQGGQEWMGWLFSVQASCNIIHALQHCLFGACLPACCVHAPPLLDIPACMCCSCP
jgi:hypothetical protein